MMSDERDFKQAMIDLNDPDETGIDAADSLTSDADPTDAELNNIQYQKNLEKVILQEVIKQKSKPNYLAWFGYFVIAVLAILGLFVIAKDSYYQWVVWGGIVGIVLLSVNVHDMNSWGGG
jgi:hypothetical protein